MGDEPDMIRKMRAGQLQIAALTGVGLGILDKEARILELPLFYPNEESVDRAVSLVEHKLAAKFEQQGYVWLGMVEGGPVYLFSSKPIQTLEDLKHLKVWSWEGDKLVQAFLNEVGISAVPLSITNVLTGLQTGILDVVYNVPLGLIALQWSPFIRTMIDLRLTQVTGALLMDKKSWDLINPLDQKIIQETTGKMVKEVSAMVRSDNARALVALRKQGIEFVSLSRGDRHTLQVSGDRVAREFLAGPLLNLVRAQMAH
jgi:TRAP-type C4-dicarboxylate transport system substrate-binding protein